MEESHLAQARQAYGERRWRQATAFFTAVGHVSHLDPRDAERLAQAAYLAGERPIWEEAWTCAYEGFQRMDEPALAARSAIWLAFAYLNASEHAHGGGWLGRAERLVSEACPESAEAGYLLLPSAIMSCDSDTQGAYETFSQALEIGRQFRDGDLMAMACHGQGRCLIRMGQATRGMALLDEVLLRLATNELSPIICGDTYCGAIEACYEASDPGRAREWTEALTAWCNEQPELTAYQGQCLVYRAALARMDGDWSLALGLGERACVRLSEPRVHSALGSAYYERGELDRLRGAFADAERWYGLAAEHGRVPQPGLALLRLTQGDFTAARSGISRLLEDTRDPLARSRVLAAAVEIFIAVGKPEAAELASGELADLAQVFGSKLLEAASTYSVGALALASGKPEVAITPLRRALTSWLDLAIPYEVGRSRRLLGRACHELGDMDEARIQLAAARETFRALGARPDLARSEDAPLRGSSASLLLTAREMEVLRLVAAGRTNRAIGEQLVISDKTVARHVANIFNKLSISSRSAATAYAYEHDLV